jgi:dephospho-CoA kinase
VVGLTGGIGSGKSTVANLFADLGVPLVDTDLIAHQLTAPHGAAMPAIATEFGTGVVNADGALDRVAMRQLAFADPDVRRRLEAILHPLIRAESQRQCQTAASDGAPYVLLVVPLLVESGTYRERCQRILVVDCPEETQLARVMARNGLAAEQVQAILAAQASRSERLAVADDVILNDGDPALLPGRVASLHRQYLALSNP